MVKAGWKYFGKHPLELEPDQWKYMSELIAIELHEYSNRNVF